MLACASALFKHPRDALKRPSAQRAARRQARLQLLGTRHAHALVPARHYHNGLFFVQTDGAPNRVCRLSCQHRACAGKQLLSGGCRGFVPIGAVCLSAPCPRRRRCHRLHSPRRWRGCRSCQMLVQSWNQLCSPAQCCSRCLGRCVCRAENKLIAGLVK